MDQNMCTDVCPCYS